MATKEEQEKFDGAFATNASAHHAPSSDVVGVEKESSTFDPRESSRSSREVPAPSPPTLEPILMTKSTPANFLRPALTSLSAKTIQSARWYGGRDGYCCYEADYEHNSDMASDQQDDKGESEKDYTVQWDEDDKMNPRNKQKWRKWIIVLTVCNGSLCVTCTSSLYTFTYPQLEKDFHSSREVATLGLSLFVMGLGLGPMILGPLSEFYGRRPIYIISYAFFIIWLIPCAVAKNMVTMLVSRFIDGFAGAAFLSVAGGSVGDLFSRAELSLPMMVYSASPFLGPEVGPLIGGFINQYTTWRWSFYVLIIWASIELILLIFVCPETYHPVLLRAKARKLRAETGDERWKAPMEKSDKSVSRTVLWSCIRPFQLLVLDPMCLSLCILSAILLGIVYLFFGAFILVFQGNHGFTQSQVGLSFIGLLVGMLMGIASDLFWHRIYDRLVRQREERGGEPGGSEPEYRLPSTVAGAVIVPISLFGFGWTTMRSVHWIAPIIFSGLFGIGNIWCFAGIFTFLVDCFPMYAASALAANSFARSSFAAAFPLFGVQMYTKLGYQWATTLLAFLSLAMAPFPYLFFKYGKRLRARSRFASG